MQIKVKGRVVSISQTRDLYDLRFEKQEFVNAVLDELKKTRSQLKAVRSPETEMVDNATRTLRAIQH